MSMVGFIFRLMFKHSMCIWGEQTVPCQTVLLTAGRSHPLLSFALTLPGQSFLLLSKSICLLTSPHNRDIWFLSPCFLWVKVQPSPLWQQTTCISPALGKAGIPSAAACK